eukprot:CAMPEP_0201480240 /NCGR_PEP_ID=MMETSP0151_2-20130828/4762_1 /ASSEMBLY_ACC=CAM_ASM_000257 /TAXON_ID=200890 /ORGANISM="Paramoeba atlantica, Strain 621/1 / CCAP 1560/9" /LENGTH=379 /DNA_ID=CAMNT_0047862033 /DNA_START=172 /DNA_END=1312 /DNA_ORIENTATION=-
MYAETSSYTYGWEGNHIGDETYVGREEIKNKLNSMELGRVKTLTVVSSQESENGGIIVVVTGYWEPANKKGRADFHRRFMETFFLVKESAGRYSIRNDILYILQNVPPVREVKPESNTDYRNMNGTAEQKSDAPIGDNAPEPAPSSVPSSPSPVIEEEDSQLDEAPQEDSQDLSEEKLEEKSEEGDVSQESSPQDQSQSPSQAQNQEKKLDASDSSATSATSQKISYAGRLRQGSAGPSAEQPKPPQQAPQQQRPPQQQQQQQQQQQNEFREHKVFVRIEKVPNITEDRLRSIFSQFGPIRGDVVINRGRGFAFITSNESEFVRRACDHSPIQVPGGGVITVEPKNLRGPRRGGGGGEEEVNGGQWGKEVDDDQGISVQ